MKKIFFLLLMCSLFVACGNDEDDIVEDALQLNLKECTLNDEKSYVIVEVTKAVGEYKVQSSNEEVAIADVIDGKIYIWGFNGGDAIVTVTDADNNKASVNIKVDGYISRIMPAMETLFVKKGVTRNFKYEYPDTKDYILSIDEEGIISGYVNGNNLFIKGEEIGQVDLMVLKDMWPIRGYGVYVVDKYPLVLNGEAMNISVGVETAIFVRIGNGGYNIESTDPAVASLNLGQYTGIESNTFCNPATINITALKTGSATITITDSEGITKDFKLTVQ